MHQGASVNTPAHTPSTNTFRTNQTTQYTPATSTYQATPFDQYGSSSIQRLIHSTDLPTSASFLPPINTIPAPYIPQYTHTSVPRQSNEPIVSPLSRIANGMLYNKPFQQVRPIRPESDNIWQQSRGNMLDRLQTQRQETSRTFNPGRSILLLVPGNNADGFSSQVDLKPLRIVE